MEIKQKKQLLEEYKNRHPEMGVILFRCIETGETFFGCSKDTKADINGSSFKLSAGNHPNKRLQELWNQYGESGFECSVVRALKYEDALEDHTKELEALREQCMAAEPKSGKIWR